MEVKFTHPSPRQYIQVSGQLHASAALPSGKESTLPTELETEWAQKTVCMPLPGTGKRDGHPLAESLTPIAQSTFWVTNWQRNA